MNRAEQMALTERRLREVSALREGGMTLRAIGKVIGRSPERVRQLIAQAEREKRRAQREQGRLGSLIGASQEDLSKIPVTDIEWSARVSNCLREANIWTVGQLVQKRAFELVRLPNFGRRSLEEVRNTLAELGLCLRGTWV